MANPGDFKPGNRLWERRARSGCYPLFDDPEKLWEACVKYFEWAESNPLKEEKVFCSQGEILQTTVNKIRAMSVSSMCVFIGMTRVTWYEYCKRPEYKDTCELVEQIIYDQKFTGAAADLLNQNIIARELGLSDKQELYGKDGAKLIPDCIKVIHD